MKPVRDGIVVDASIALSWRFPDEQAPLCLKVLDRLNTGHFALVPAFFLVEVLNALLVGERKGRISPEQTRDFLEGLRVMRPMIDPTNIDKVLTTYNPICRAHALTRYDALDVEFAMRSGHPLASLDRLQREAALAVGVVFRSSVFSSHKGRK